MTAYSITNPLCQSQTTNCQKLPLWFALLAPSGVPFLLHHTTDLSARIGECLRKAAGSCQAARERGTRLRILFRALGVLPP
jgi:hypothetical protein